MTMDLTNLMAWTGPTVDVAAVVLLAAVLWRLGRDPGAAWGEREARLQTIFDDLRTLVAQSEGLARDLDGKLAGREERLQALLAEARTTFGAPAGAPAPAEVAAPSATARQRPTRVEVREDDPTATARRIEQMIDEGADADAIARRLGVPVPEVGLVLGLKAARAARRRVAAQEASAHA
jgi:hypothetical protein